MVTVSIAVRTFYWIIYPIWTALRWSTFKWDGQMLVDDTAWTSERAGSGTEPPSIESCVLPSARTMAGHNVQDGGFLHGVTGRQCGLHLCPVHARCRGRLINGSKDE